MARLKDRMKKPHAKLDADTVLKPESSPSDLFAGIPRRSPADLVALARAQGIRPVSRIEDLLGKGPADGDEFDIDAFLAARKQWQLGRVPSGERLAEPDDVR